MKGYWFCENDRLGYGDGRIAAVGVTHEVPGRPVLCDYGLHASRHVADALICAPGPVLYRVCLGGEVVRGRNKAAGTIRAYFARIDATDVLRRYARLCALDVIDLWDAPEVVVRYLRTGDESLRVAAWTAAWDAVRYAAWDAVRYAVTAAASAAWAAASAAVSAAKYAARDAARASKGAAGTSAWIARNAVAATAWTAARAKQRRRLARMVRREFQIAEREVTP